jgi:hypothetical protein
LNAANIRICIALIALALPSVSSGCSGPQPLPLPGRGGTPRQPTGSAAGNRTKDIRVDVKRVAGKEPPATLIAEDHTRCVVTEGRYRETEIGSDAWCAWRAP